MECQKRAVVEGKCTNAICHFFLLILVSLSFFFILQILDLLVSLEHYSVYIDIASTQHWDGS